MAGFVDDNATNKPPLGAAPVNINVPCCTAPPVIDDTCSFNDRSAAGFTVIDFDFVRVPAVAVMLTNTRFWTGVEPMTNDALVAPAGT
jgi:hypothetical protein